MVSTINMELVDPKDVIPRYYGEDQLVLLPRDPHWLFAYWEISLPTRQGVFREWDETTRVEALPHLRVFRHRWQKMWDIESYYDISLNEDTDDWYIQVSNADNFYHVELGWILPGGNFFSLLQSRPVRTPRDTISDIIDENWRLPDWKSRRLYRRISMYHLSSAELIHRKVKKP